MKYEIQILRVDGTRETQWYTPAQTVVPTLTASGSVHDLSDTLTL